MERKIFSVAVIGGGTMGSGIAAHCAQNGLKVLLLEIDNESVEKAYQRIIGGRSPLIDNEEKIPNLTVGVIDADFEKIGDSDWICEAVTEDLNIKRSIFERIERFRKPGSIVSTNTSGIPLNAIIEQMPDRLQKDVAVTHFFNPVKVMKLVELVPGRRTDPEVLSTLKVFLKQTLGKGVVSAKDTVNFIGNRIGCFWILSGLHHANQALERGVSIEEVDELISKSMSLPPTGLFGLVDLVGLDVMDLVAKNLKENLSSSDPCLKFTNLPPKINEMLKRGQVGRKAGGGFYRVSEDSGGLKVNEVFDVSLGKWRRRLEPKIPSANSNLDAIYLDNPFGELLWRITGGTLAYSAGLIPEISDDLINIDRAMKWGYAWKLGPFELLDSLDPTKFIEKLALEELPIPKMMDVLIKSKSLTFYSGIKREYLGLDGRLHKIPSD